MRKVRVVIHNTVVTERIVDIRIPDDKKIEDVVKELEGKVSAGEEFELETDLYDASSKVINIGELR